jgi:hypothetical protein
MSEKTEKIKKHFRDNKKSYVIGGSCLTIGVVVGVVICRQTTQVAIANPAVVNWKPVSNIVQIQMVRPGQKAFVVQCLDDQRIWPSITAAAKDLGIDPKLISGNIKGLLDDAKGLHFEKIAEI